MKSEQQIQKKISDQMEKDGWYVIKLISTNKNGIPDLVCLKGDDVQFIEVKKPGGVVSKLQKYRIKELNDRGIKAEVRYE
jgi:Holliday junction resolvase